MTTDPLETILKAARDAAAAADVMTRYLLVAGGRKTDAPTCREYLARAFHARMIFERAMNDLEGLAPNAAAQGRDDDAAIREVVLNAMEARGAAA